MVKGGNWISDAAGNPTISGPEITHVSMSSTGSIHPSLYNSHMPLTSNGTQIGWEVGRPEDNLFSVCGYRPALVDLVHITKKLRSIYSVS